MGRARPSWWTRAFQSTPPARGATAAMRCSAEPISDFNPRPPRGGRRHQHRQLHGIAPISIHAPREGGDSLAARSSERRCPFQSTPPARGATWATSRSGTSTCYFNPRPPRGGRHHDVVLVPVVILISIHAPREGGDQRTFHQDHTDRIFQSTPPARGATFP